MAGEPGGGIRKLWEELEANDKRLLACATPHDFRAPLNTSGRWKCFKCGGEATTSAVLWYRRGLAHARGERNS